MIGTQVEREGIIRHGAKMISAVSEATVPKLSVIVRKAYGAGLYAMAGPAFDPDGCIALPSASIAVMGPQAAINAVYYNQLQAIEDEHERAGRTEELRDAYAEDIDILHLASELVVDAVIEPDALRGGADPPLRQRAGKLAQLAGQAQPGHARLKRDPGHAASSIGLSDGRPVDLAYAGIARQAELIARRGDLLGRAGRALPRADRAPGPAPERLPRRVRRARAAGSRTGRRPPGRRRRARRCWACRSPSRTTSTSPAS